MKASEADKIIAEFMGDIFYHKNGAKDLTESYIEGTYCQSLDALVPVWEKLIKEERNWWNDYKISYSPNTKIWTFRDYQGFEADHESLCIAATLTTAKAILDFKNNPEEYQ